MNLHAVMVSSQVPVTLTTVPPERYEEGTRVRGVRGIKVGKWGCKRSKEGKGDERRVRGVREMRGG